MCRVQAASGRTTWEYHMDGLMSGGMSGALGALGGALWSGSCDGCHGGRFADWPPWGDDGGVWATMRVVFRGVHKGCIWGA